MKKTIVNNLVHEYEPGVNTVVGIQVETNKETFTIPVVDVRTSENHRKKATKIIKNRNAHQGSKFMKTSYSLWGYKYN